jgi:HK97 family phage major capsid protein
MPDGELKIGSLTREMVAEIQIRRADPAAGTAKSVVLTFSGSSEAPVERWFGTEILSHEPSAVRLARAKAGALPLLFNHNRGDAIGMVDSVIVNPKTRKTEVEAHFFDTERAREVEKMVDGGLRNVSLRYEIFTIEEETKSARFTATDWEPLEYSIVTIPADFTVGLGRAQDEQASPVRLVRSDTPPAQSAEPLKEQQMTTSVVVETPAAGARADEPKIGAVEAEKERREAILAIGKANKIDSRVQNRWIEEGTPLTKVAGEVLDVMEERGKAAPVSASQVGLSRKETQRYSLFRAIRAMEPNASTADREAAAFELECTEQVAKQLGRSAARSILVPGEVLQRPLGEAATRAMATTPGSKGGYMIGVENMGFIDILRNRSVAMAMGSRTLSGLTGNVMFPRQTGKPSVTWQGGDGTSITAADQTLGQLSMTPKTVIAITDVSEQLLRQASPSAEAFIMADLAADVAIDGVDYAVINGTGGAQPVGIKNTSGITSSQDASSATYAKILAFVSTAGALNAIRGNPGFVTTTAGAAKLMQVQRFTSTDTPIWEGNMMDGQLVGFNAMSSEQLASGNLIFGSWDEVVIGDWGVLELKLDGGGTRFNQGQIGIRALWMVDVLVRYPTAFVVSTNLS